VAIWLGVRAAAEGRSFNPMLSSNSKSCSDSGSQVQQSPLAWWVNSSSDVRSDTKYVRTIRGPVNERRKVRSGSAPVTTTQVAPTILKALGIRTQELDAVRLEHTLPLAHLGR
jgi:hypothetical protein